MRTSTYTVERADLICRLLAEGRSLRQVERMQGMPARSIIRWLEERDDFRELYASACQRRAWGIADEILDIADNASEDWRQVHGPNGTTYYVINHDRIARDKLRCDSRKWLLARMMPKKFRRASLTSIPARTVDPSPSPSP